MKFRLTIWGDSTPFTYSFISEDQMTGFFLSQAEKGDWSKGKEAFMEQHDGYQFVRFRRFVYNAPFWEETPLSGAQ
jgi:hypothetical protein